MRAMTAYFAGVGTVSVAIAAGLFGGLFISDLVSPKANKATQPTKLEQRMSPDAIRSVTAEPTPPATAPDPATTPIIAATAAPASQTAKTATPPEASPATPSSANVQPASAKPQPALQPAPQTAAQAERPPQDSFAKGRDTEIKRNADRQAAERRRSERRKWAERRDRDQELYAVEDMVRSETDHETEPQREMVIERRDAPRFRVFNID